ncbi:hybrid sensor histidine kinase/response regulator [Bacteroidia bacterium]|nr:hybrid sensor histidine kinase/response regulator [Bacteroidia bacterium]GHV38799.1 hybrid sensor histidine kinase/response regulator [Bacteroidia bacterium]
MSINDQNGLSHHNVKSIIQDGNGFIWFGTLNKLNRFDGVNMEVYDCYSPRTGKRNNNISSLFVDAKNKIWVGTDKGVFVFNPVTEIFSSFDYKTEKGIEITQWVEDIQMDNDGFLWIVVPNQGVFKFNPGSEKLILYSVVDEVLPSVSNPQCIAIEKNGRVWIGTNGSGIYLYDSKNDSFVQYADMDNSKESVMGKNIFTICHYEEQLIIGIHEERLLLLDKRNGIVSHMGLPEIDFKIIRHLAIYDSDLWVSTQDGLFSVSLDKIKLSKTNGQLAFQKHLLSDNYIEKTYQDSEGGIWIGTYFSGACYFPNKKNIFNCYIPQKSEQKNLSSRIREMREDNNGNIWIGTEDAGLMFFDTTRKHFSKVPKTTHNKRTLGMLMQDSKLWVGYFKGGVDIIDLQNNSVKHYSSETLGLNEESIYALCEDRKGKIWLGNAWGIFVSGRQNDKFSGMKEFGLCFVHDIMEDTEGYIWVATLGNGVFQFNPDNQELIHFTSNKDNSISSNSVNSITEDHLGNIWFSTDRGGACMYNKKDRRFKTYTIKDGLPDDITYKILEDKDHNLWFGTNKGLVRLTPHTNEVKVYTQNDGLLSNRFNYKAALIANDGTFYFGGLDGLVTFRPGYSETNKFIPPVYITKLTIGNKEVSPQSDVFPIQESIIYTKELTLNYDQSNIMFYFIALSYTSPKSNLYAYKLENVDDNWVTTNNNYTASYAKLSPGEYTLRVKGSNNDGLWNNEEASIKLVILPPWWKSTLAYISYCLLIVLAISLLVCYFLKKSRDKSIENQHIFEIKRDKEIYEAKVDFFTNIAHEIRTPLTLINGPLESIMEYDIQNEDIKYNLDIINRNTNQLLQLINQLLDFRKVDSNKFTLDIQQINVNQFISEIISQFEKEITLKKIQLNFTEERESPILAAADKDAFTKILNNLLSNAIKYSKSKIYILVTADDDYYTITIMNDGELIPANLKDKIFEPFFQVKSSQKETYGSGIGLSLTRSLVEMHGGYVYYENQQDMNVFTLKMPVVNKMHKQIKILLADQETKEESLTQQNIALSFFSSPKQTILIVEDNTDMLHFISKELKDEYITESAGDGYEALDVLKSKQIDVIISDVMMPNMDGFELCKIVRENSDYNNIIFILLTAKNDLPSKVEGLKIGANAYVEKPFSIKYLTSLLETLIKNRQRDIEQFLKKPYLSVSHQGEKDFLEKVVELVNMNITDYDFNVETLAERLNLSRSSLHRKIKNLTNSSPIEFIRLIRLQKAVLLIQDGKYRINEICHLVGINSPSYFIKLFQIQYGMTPKEFSEKIKKH